MKDSSSFANIVAMKQIQSDFLKNTKSKYMKESNILVYIVNIKQLQIDNLKKKQRKLIKKSNTVANIAAIKEFKKEILNNTKSQCMRSQVPLYTLQLWGNYKGTFAKISDMNQLQMGNNKKNHQKSVYRCVKYHCKHCSYKVQ